MAHSLEPPGAGQQALGRLDEHAVRLFDVTDQSVSLTGHLSDDIQGCIDESLHGDNIEHQERLKVDLELRNFLQQHNFSGPAWKLFAEELARYALAVVRLWLETGEIFFQCKRKRCYPGPPPEWWTKDDREELANAVVAEALRTFRQRALIEEGWKVEGGASLKTYFIGTCTLEFPNLFRKWKKEEEQIRELLSIEGLIETSHDRYSLSGRSTSDTVTDSILAWDAFRQIKSGRVKAVILLTGMGYSASEIAEVFQVTKKAIEMTIARQRKRANVANGHGGPDAQPF